MDHGPDDAIAAGLYLVPEDRKDCGLILDFPIAENISLADLAAVSERGFVDRAPGASRAAEAQRDSLDIRAPDVTRAVAELSGGNQQKVVLGKWLSMRPRVMIFDEPTRGIDVGAKAEIYRLMRGLADAGVAILMISSDMEEVIGVSDRDRRHEPRAHHRHPRAERIFGAPRADHGRGLRKRRCRKKTSGCWC